jgi:hypothetical protein
MDVDYAAEGPAGSLLDGAQRNCSAQIQTKPPFGLTSKGFIQRGLSAKVPNERLPPATLKEPEALPNGALHRGCRGASGLFGGAEHVMFGAWILQVYPRPARIPNSDDPSHLFAERRALIICR